MPAENRSVPRQGAAAPEESVRRPSGSMTDEDLPRRAGALRSLYCLRYRSRISATILAPVWFGEAKKR